MARRAADRALAALVAIWGVLALLPIGEWAGLVEPGHYGSARALWWRTLVVVLLGTALALVVTRGRIAAGVRAAGRAVLRMPRGAYLTLLGALAGGGAAAVSVLCFARNPQTVDAWAQFFEARVFLSGALTAPPPPSVAHFATLHMLITDAVWTAQYPPVHPALLALGMAAGAAWLVTPLLTALLPAAVWLVGRRTGDERIARLAAALVVASPFVLAMGASAMNHVPAALCVALGLWALPDVARGRAGAAAVLGAAVGLCIGLRPLDGLLLAAVGAVPVCGALRRRRGAALGALALAGAGALLPTLVFNLATTGSPLRFTYVALYGAGLALGFHSGPWGEILTPLRAAGHTALDAHRLNVYLLEWPVPVTLLVAAGLALRRGRLGRGLRDPAAYLLLLVGTIFFYFHRDTLYGPRFLFSALPAVLVLLAAALVRLTAVGGRLGWRGLTVGDVLLVGLVVGAALALGDLAPRRLASYQTTGTALALHPERDAARAGIGRAVVVIPDGWGARLIARLWDAGVPMAETGRIYRALDACTLEEALATADGRRGAALAAHLARAAAGAGAGRAVPGLTRDPLLRLPDDGHLTPRCAAEIARDQRGTLQFAPYVWLNTPGLDGDIVWARELGDGDEALRRLFPDRALWRYAPVPPDGPPTFTRVEPPTGARVAAR